MREFKVLQSPFRGYEKVGRRLADKPFQYQVFPKKLNIPGYQLDVFFHGIEMEWVFGIHSCELSPFDYLHLVDFQNVEWERRYNRGLP